MVGRGIVGGERLGASEWAGIAWGTTSLLGRSSRSDPLAATAAHFAYAAPLTLVSSLVAAGLVQLSVPTLAALGGVLLLGEDVTVRLVLSAVAILGGIALAVASRRA